MRIINKKFVALFVMIILVICCGLTACNKPNNPEEEQPQPVYTQAKLQISGNGTIEVGETLQLSASAHARKGNGNYVTSTDGITFESSNVSVATVDSYGAVKALSEGYAEIVASHKEYGAKSSKTIRVIAPLELNISERVGLNVHGRVKSDENGLALVNSASGFEVMFKGTELKAKINSANDIGKDYLRVVVDGESNIVEIPQNNTDIDIALATDLSDGLHSVSVYKMLDEGSSQIKLKNLFGDGAAFYSAPEKSELKISVYGDHISAGYGLMNESEQDVSAKNQDVTATYAFMAAQELNADIDFVCLEDISLAVKGKNDAYYMKDVWNKYSILSEDDYDVTTDASDVIVINLGENDAYGINQNQNNVAGYSESTRKNYIDGYKAMIGQMRATNPNAKIICCYGMTALGGGLSAEITQMVKDINKAGDANVFALNLIECEGRRLSEAGYPNRLGHSENAQLLVSRILGILGGSYKPNFGNDNDDPNKENISVILLAGQSNMEGNSWYEYLESDANYQEYRSGYNDIQMSYVNHESKANSQMDLQPVRLGFGGCTDKQFGPEIGIAKTLHENGYGNKVVLIKFAIGGTHFYGGAGRTWQAPVGGNSAGQLYTACVTYFNTCLNSLSQIYNVSLDALFWMQGESDTDTKAAASAYENNLKNFKIAIRNEFAKYNANLRIYDGFISQGWDSSYEGNDWTVGDNHGSYITINQAKQNLSDTDLNHIMIDTISAGLEFDKEPANVDWPHYDASSEIKLGRLFAEAYMKDFPLPVVAQ